MNAIHSCWTKPFFVRGGQSFFMEDFDILTTMLSALVWQQNGGSIKMLTDSTGAEYFRSRRLEKLWNGGIETPLDSIPKNIDPFLFWAGGKLWALKSCPQPVCMVDTDMIVWHDLTGVLAGKEIAVAHREDIMPDVYPPKEYFRMKDGYRFPCGDWSAAPCNTAFLYISDMSFRDYYIECSMEFMQNLREDSNVVIPMVFAEQRLLAMCAAEKGKPIFSLLDQYHLKEQGLITHVWGHKSRLRADKNERADYCRRCIRRIRRDFPAAADSLWNIPEIINHLYSENYS